MYGNFRTSLRPSLSWKKTEEPPSTKDQHINRSHFCFSNHFIHCLTQMKWLFQNLCGRNDSAYSVRECRIFLYMLYAMYVIISVLFKLFYMLMVGNEIFHSHRSILTVYDALAVPWFPKYPHTPWGDIEKGTFKKVDHRGGGVKMAD